MTLAGAINYHSVNTFLPLLLNISVALTLLPTFAHLGLPSVILTQLLLSALDPLFLLAACRLVVVCPHILSLPLLFTLYIQTFFAKDLNILP